VYHGPEDVRVEDVPRPETENSGDALVRVIHTAICGSDLWPYRGHSDRDTPSRLGYEPMGIIEEVGEDVWSVQPGDRVFVPFVVSCGECEFCRRGLHTSCVNGDSWSGDNGGAQGKYVRSPHADGTLVRIPDRYDDDEETLRAALPLTDVLGTGHYADRLDVAEAFGATDTVLGGEGGVDDEAERVRDLTHGGAEHVLECVSATSAMETAVGACRPGETVGYVGVPHGTGDALDLFDSSETISRSPGASHRYMRTPTTRSRTCSAGRSTPRPSSRRRSRWKTSTKAIARWTNARQSRFS